MGRASGWQERSYGELNMQETSAKQSQTWAGWGIWEWRRGSCTNEPTCPKRGTGAVSAVAAGSSPSIPVFHVPPFQPNSAKRTQFGAVSDGTGAWWAWDGGRMRKTNPISRSWIGDGPAARRSPHSLPPPTCARAVVQTNPIPVVAAFGGPHPSSIPSSPHSSPMPIVSNEANLPDYAGGAWCALCKVGGTSNEGPVIGPGVCGPSESSFWHRPRAGGLLPGPGGFPASAFAGSCG